MPSLADLGFVKNWTYEVVISCNNGNTPHAAPFGIKTSDLRIIQAVMYNSSNTLRYIIDKGCFVINLMSDPQFFYDSLYAKYNIRFKPARIIDAPVIVDAPAFIEVKVIDYYEKADSHIINAEILNIEVTITPELYNRAKSLVMESLITATRIKYLPEGKAEEILKENYRVIKKVAPESTYVETMEKLLNKCGIY